MGDGAGKPASWMRDLRTSGLSAGFFHVEKNKYIAEGSISSERDGMRLRSRENIVDQVERSHRTIEYGLGVVVPGLLACMLFSYVLLPSLFGVFFALAILAAVVMVIPARRINELSYQCWSKDAMPHTIATSLLGMIYISEMSIFSVSLLSLYNGLEPWQPSTFAVLGGLSLGLVFVLAYYDKHRESIHQTDVRLFPLGEKDASVKVTYTLTNRGQGFVTRNGAGGTLIDLKDQDLKIRIRPVDQVRSEIVLQRGEQYDADLLESLKQEL